MPSMHPASAHCSLSAHHVMRPGRGQSAAASAPQRYCAGCAHCCDCSPGASHSTAAVRLAERAHAQRRAHGSWACVFTGMLSLICTCHTHTACHLAGSRTEQRMPSPCIIPPLASKFMQCQHIMSCDPTQVSQRPPAHRADVLRMPRSCCCSSPGASHASAAVRLAERAHAQPRAHGRGADCLASILSARCGLMGFAGGAAPSPPSGILLSAVLPGVAASSGLAHVVGCRPCRASGRALAGTPLSRACALDHRSIWVSPQSPSRTPPGLLTHTEGPLPALASGAVRWSAPGACTASITPPAAPPCPFCAQLGGRLLLERLPLASLPCAAQWAVSLTRLSAGGPLFGQPGWRSVALLGWRAGRLARCGPAPAARSVLRPLLCAAAVRPPRPSAGRRA